MKAQHTPGPWEVLGAHIVTSYQDERSEHKNKRAYICKTTYANDGTMDDEQQANARLIAAAPSMFEALTTIRDALRDGSLWGNEKIEDTLEDLDDRIVEVLKRVRGKQ